MSVLKTQFSSGCSRWGNCFCFKLATRLLDKLTAHATRKLFLNCLINELQFSWPHKLCQIQIQIQILELCSYRYRYKCLTASSLLGELIRSAHNSVPELSLGLLPGCLGQSREGICYAKPITGHRSCYVHVQCPSNCAVLGSNLFLEHLEVYIMRCNLSKLSVSRPAATVCLPASQPASQPCPPTSSNCPPACLLLLL